MNRFSLRPDGHMQWIYDSNHPDYNTDHAKDLRNRRANALDQVPQWMFFEAFLNDEENPVTQPNHK